MSDGLRIDLALERAAGLPAPPPGATGSPLPSRPPTSASADPTFSPLALLLARGTSPSTGPSPTLTADEARLLQAHLQQRVVAVLRDAGVTVPPTLRVLVDADGALRLTPTPFEAGRVTQALAQAPDVARLAQWLHAATIPESNVARHDESADIPTARASAVAIPDARRFFPWRIASDASDDGARTPRGIPAWALPFVIVGLLLLAWQLFG